MRGGGSPVLGWIGEKNRRDILVVDRYLCYNRIAQWNPVEIAVRGGRASSFCAILPADRRRPSLFNRLIVPARDPSRTHARYPLLPRARLSRDSPRLSPTTFRHYWPASSILIIFVLSVVSASRLLENWASKNQRIGSPTEAKLEISRSRKEMN